MRYEITDYSVEVLSEAETEELRRKERENREKEEKGESARKLPVARTGKIW